MVLSQVEKEVITVNRGLYDLSDTELRLFEREFKKKRKYEAVALIIWLLTGIIGGHRYYLGSIPMGVVLTLTLGGFGVVAILDVFNIKEMTAKKNAEIEDTIIKRIKQRR